MLSLISTPCPETHKWRNKYRGADKSLARPGRKQANVSVRMAWICFGTLPCRKKINSMTSRVSMLLKSRASLTCFRACFLPGRAKDLSANRLYLHSFLTSTLDRDKWLNSRSVRFTSQKVRRCPLNKRLGSPSAGVEVSFERKLSCPYWNSNRGRTVLPQTPIHS